jgi:hypothetical protein
MQSKKGKNTAIKQKKTTSRPGYFYYVHDLKNTPNINAINWTNRLTEFLKPFDALYLERQLRWRQGLSCGSRRGYLKRPSAVIPPLTGQSLNSC